MPVAGIDEQLGLAGRLYQCPGRVEVALVGEERVGVHAVNLYGHALRPCFPELRNRDAGIEQQCSLGPGAGLGQLLCWKHPHREAGIHEVAGKFFGGMYPSLHQVAEADFPGVGHARLDASEGLAPEEVWSVDGVPRLPQFVRESGEARRLPLCVVEQHHFSHLVSPRTSRVFSPADGKVHSESALVASAKHRSSRPLYIRYYINSDLIYVNIRSVLPSTLFPQPQGPI